MDMLELKDVEDYEGLDLDSWGIPTPSEDSLDKRKNCFGGWGKSEDLEVGEERNLDVGKVENLKAGEGENLNGKEGEEDELDLIITPGLGFDRNLGRIGRGKGFYDCFFERCAQFSRSGKVPWKGEFNLFFQLSQFGFKLRSDGTCALALKMSGTLTGVVDFESGDADPMKY